MSVCRISDNTQAERRGVLEVLSYKDALQEKIVADEKAGVERFHGDDWLPHIDAIRACCSIGEFGLVLLKNSVSGPD